MNVEEHHDLEIKVRGHLLTLPIYAQSYDVAEIFRLGSIFLPLHGFYVH